MQIELPQYLVQRLSLLVRLFVFHFVFKDSGEISGCMSLNSLTCSIPIDYSLNTLWNEISLVGLHCLAG